MNSRKWLWGSIDGYSIMSEDLIAHYINHDTSGAQHIRNYLRTEVINCVYNGEDPVELAHRVTNDLARLLCCGKDPSEELSRLRALLGNSGPCGKTLSTGEPTFTCSDCALDPTCVMCMECYNASIHATEKHNLAVHTSSGSGMCDCGDKEAWTSGHTCSIHEGSHDDSTPLDEKLPEKNRFIAYELFKEIMTISVACFRETQDGYFIPEYIRPDPNNNPVIDKYVTVVFNDEVHNFDEVIQQFRTLMNTSQSEGSQNATAIDREGRMLIKRGTKEESEKLRDTFLQYRPRVRRATKEPLVTRSFPEYDYVLQDLLIEVIQWLSDLCQENPAYRRIHCKVSLENRPECLVRRIMLDDVTYWKRVKTTLHKLFMSSYFIDALYKPDLGILFIENYGAMLSAFLDDNKRHDFNYSIISLTVQLFTVPSISELLVTEHNALEVIFEQYVNFYKPHLIQENNIVRIGNLPTHSVSEEKRRDRMLHIMKDAKYILSNIPDNFSPKVEEAFLAFFRMYAEFNASLQEMNPHVRKSGNHISRDKEWNQYFVLEICEIRDVNTSVAKWCQKTNELFRMCTSLLAMFHYDTPFKLCKKLSSVTSYPSLHSLVTALGGGPNTATWEKEHKESRSRLLFPYQVSHVQHDMFKDPVSFHIPGTRLLFSIICEMDSPERFAYVEDLLKDPLRSLILDIPLRTILLSQQIESLMWKRNGLSMENQMRCYRESCKSSLWDKDLLSMQVIMALSPVDDTLVRIIHKYKIESYFTILKSEQESYGPLLKMVECFGYFMLHVLTERHKPGMSHTTEEDIYIKDLIHTFSLSDLPRSKAIRSLIASFVSFDNFQNREAVVDDMLRQLTTQQPTDSGVSVNLRLRPEWESEFTPFYYHFSAEQRQIAERKFTQRFTNNPNFEYRPPTLPRFKRPYGRLRDYLVSPIMQRFFYVVLTRFASNSTGVMVSDLLFHQVLFLIVFGLEDDRNTAHLSDDSDGSSLFRRFHEVLNAFDNEVYLIPEENQQSIASLLRQISSMTVRCVREMYPVIRWILDTLETFDRSGDSDLPSGHEPMDTTPAPEKVITEVDKKKEQSLRARQELLKRFKMEQAAFLQQNATMFDNIENDMIGGEESEEGESPQEEGVACGPNKGPLPRHEATSQTCILCKESEAEQDCKNTMIYGCLIEKSVVLKPEFHSDIDDKLRIRNLFTEGNLHIQSCGHPMHYNCLYAMVGPRPPSQNLEYQFLASVMTRYKFNHGEFSCPLCKMAANVILPVTTVNAVAVGTLPDATTAEFLSEIEEELSGGSSPGDEEIPGPPESPGDDSMFFDHNLDHRGMSINAILNFPDGGALRGLLDEDVSGDALMLEIPSIQVAGENEENPPPYHNDLAFSEDAQPAEKFRDEMRRFYRRVRHMHGTKDPVFECSAPFTLKMVSYTFTMLEFNLREKALMAGIAEYQGDFLHTLLRILFQSLSTHDHLYSQELTRELKYLFSGVKREEAAVIPSILNLDVFTVFVAGCFFFRSDQKCFNGALVELCVTAEISKILLAVESSEEMIADASAADSDAIELATTWGHLRKLSQLSATDDPFPCPTSLVHTVKTSLLPLLRKMALFLRYLTGIQSPAALAEMQSREGEFILLMKYLNLASLSDVLGFGKVQGVARSPPKWYQTLDVPRFQRTSDFNRTKREGKLVDLPENFVELLYKSSQYICPNVKVQARSTQSTALCLICGQFTCFYNYCCRGTIDGKSFGPGNLHANRCSGDLGVFLNFEKCQVFILPVRSCGMYITGPYFDKYGENFKYSRNKALTLNQSVYERIERMWVKHELRPMTARNCEGVRYIANEDGYAY